jgi:hypothetical protein
MDKFLEGLGSIVITGLVLILFWLFCMFCFCVGLLIGIPTLIIVGIVNLFKH